jgi:hypothetical protein
LRQIRRRKYVGDLHNLGTKKTLQTKWLMLLEVLMSLIK